MRAALDHLDRTEHGLLLRFPNEPAVEADVRRFAVDEKRCCPFWGFEIGTTPDQITLRWDGSPDVADFLDRLHAYFLGDEPPHRPHRPPVRPIGGYRSAISRPGVLYQ